MKFITKNCTNILLLILLLIIIYFIYYFTKNLFMNCGFEGSYVRIYGDASQPKYFDNIKTYKGNKFVYYDDNKKIINSGISIKSLFLNNYTSYHDFSKSNSECTKLFYNNKYSTSICKGQAETKFGKNKINYTSIHRYNNIDNIIYYENTYYFTDGTISSAIYKKIK